MRRLTAGLLLAWILGCGPKPPAAPPEAETVARPPEPAMMDPAAAAPSPDPKRAVPLRSLRPREDLVSEPASEATCDALADAALTALEPLASPCTSAHDCEVVPSVCPLGCFRLVSKLADAAEAQPAVDAYFARCRPCKNTCAAPPQAVACAENRCFASP